MTDLLLYIVGVNTLTHRPSCQLAPCLSLQSRPCCPCYPCLQSPHHHHHHHSFLRSNTKFEHHSLFNPTKKFTIIFHRKCILNRNLTSTSKSVHSTITWNIHPCGGLCKSGHATHTHTHTHSIHLHTLSTYP